jgi:hypothetical protein
MEPLFCHYRNSTDRMRIIRCCGPDQFFLERVVFPFELLSFRCPAGSDVEIRWRDRDGSAASEHLPAEELHSPEGMAGVPPAWWPLLPSRRVGVRDNASAVCLQSP